MYDIKSIECGNVDSEQQIDKYYQIITANYLNSDNKNCCDEFDCSSTNRSQKITTENDASMLIRFRRRVFQRQACLLSVMAAFSLGLTLGVFVPIIGLSAAFSSDQAALATNSTRVPIQHEAHFMPNLQVPSAYSIDHTLIAKDSYPVSFIHGDDNEGNVEYNQKPMPAEEVFKNAFHLETDKSAEDTMIVKKLDAQDGSIKEFKVQRTSDGLFKKGPEIRLSKPSLSEQVLASASLQKSVNLIKIRLKDDPPQPRHPSGVIADDIYWGDVIEKGLPKGFNEDDSQNWNAYIASAGSSVARLEIGCGRMQNRLIIFADGKRACARYRQNTDQIQGELFSFFLGQLLNLTNLAPSAAAVIDFDANMWSPAVQYLQAAQWKSTRPVVLTKWLPDLEPAGIPQPFQPLERHLNKFDIWNMTTTAMYSVETTVNDVFDSYKESLRQSQPSLLIRLGAVSDQSNNQKTAVAAGSVSGSIAGGNKRDNNHDRVAADFVQQPESSSSTLNSLIELAQWSDLIVFDYLIANLDRVVNNLYNYQWNADIMAAPAHNLARQSASQLLVFLDNESGLLHGYRLLKKYEAYHGLLLDNLCVFRRPTIEALKWLRDYGVGDQLQQMFEKSTSPQVRDVLPSLPDKSIKILVDRIDRVLGQVQKCHDLFYDR